MSKPKQVSITAELIGRCLHSLDELGDNIHYVVLIEGVPKAFSNSTELHAAKIIERQWLLNNKIEEYKIEQEAENQTGWRTGDKES